MARSNRSSARASANPYRPAATAPTCPAGSTNGFETAEQGLLELEQGERKALSNRPRPLLEREPLKVWRTLALLSLLGNLALLILLAGRV